MPRTTVSPVRMSRAKEKGLRGWWPGTRGRLSSSRPTPTAYALFPIRSRHRPPLARAFFPPSSMPPVSPHVHVSRPRRAGGFSVLIVLVMHPERRRCPSLQVPDREMHHRSLGLACLVRTSGPPRSARVCDFPAAAFVATRFSQ